MQIIPTTSQKTKAQLKKNIIRIAKSMASIKKDLKASKVKGQGKSKNT